MKKLNLNRVGVIFIVTTLTIGTTACVSNPSSSKSDEKKYLVKDLQKYLSEARLPIYGDDKNLTIEQLKKSLKSAEIAKELGSSEGASLHGTLSCALNENPKAFTTTFDRHSLNHYDVKGIIKSINDKSDEGATEGATFNFSPSGFLLKANFSLIHIHHYYNYDQDCNMLEWKAVNSSTGAVVNFEKYSYSGVTPIKRTHLTVLNGGSETVNYTYYPQNDGSVFQYWHGSESSSLKQ